MTRSRVGLSWCLAVLSIWAVRLGAQEAVIVGGHVSAAGNPVQGATVRIPALGLSSTTSSEGRYSLVVPSTKVRGQTVDLVARHVRYNIESTPITLTGGSVVKDFELTPAGEPRAEARGSAAVPADVQPVVAARGISARAVVDSTAFEEAAGPIDLISGLAGRVAGVVVTTPSTMGGSAPIVVRGYRSIVNNVQPLFVVDGVPLENSVFTTPGQVLGSGGFDYGTPVQGVNPADIASVTLLQGPEAAVLYGGRAANGVFLITTKNGHGLSGLEISGAQQFSGDGVLRLPTFQNSYGQGLGGKFSFFDGAGGGTNDAVAENWGPALQGAAVAQFSFSTPRKADVRPFLPFPNNVSGFYGSGRTLKTDIAAQGANDHFSGRFSANRRDTRGLTPSSSLVRQGAAVVANDQLSSALSASVQARYNAEDGHNRPGTGVDVGNPAAELVRIGRQVDVGSLKSTLVDFAGRQISWNYAGFNNPYFLTNQNDNRDKRTGWTLGGAATYAKSPKFAATIRGGRDQYDQSRNFDVDSSWMGGFAYFAGRGDFSKGGFQRQRITASETNADVVVTSTLAQGQGPSAASVVLSGGAGTRSTDFQVVSDGSDQSTKPSPGTVTPTARISSSSTTTSAFASADWISDVASARAGVRTESYSILSSSQIYPSLSGTLDLFKLAGMKAGGITSARLHAGWSRAGGEISPLLLRTIFSQSGSTPTAVSLSPSLSPEVTNAIEVGAAFGLLRNRASLDLTAYNDKTSDVVLGVAGATSGSIVASNVGAISNKGVEATVTLVPLRNPTGIDWTIEGRYAKNSNTVDELRTGSGVVALTPSLFGVTVQARQGYALGTLVGTAYRRDAATGSLLLQNGLPVAETQSRVLGVMAPDWTGSLSSTVRYWNFELSGLLDIHRGGSLFSATNLLGMSSGSFQETAFRPDSGIVIAGIDAATGKANAQHVSTEAYYHALRGIAEPWIYDGSFVKLRDLRLTFSLPLRSLPVLTAQSARVSLIGRNLGLWTSVPNVDPETALSAGSLQGIEMGQLPSARSVGIQLSITP